MRIEITVATLAVEGLSGQEAAALVAAAERALNAHFGGDAEPDPAGLADPLAAGLAAAIREGWPG